MMGTIRRAGWERDRAGKSTGEMSGIDAVSLFAIAGDEWKEAMQSMCQPPYKWGEWAAVFHPRAPSMQIVGYVRLRPGDWYVIHAETDEITGPYKLKRHALLFAGVKRSRKLSAGLYEAGDYIVFTRANCEEAGVGEEQLP